MGTQARLPDTNEAVMLCRDDHISVRARESLRKLFQVTRMRR